MDTSNKKRGRSSCKQKQSTKDLEVMVTVSNFQRATLMSLPFAINILKTFS